MKADFPSPPTPNQEAGKNAAAILGFKHGFQKIRFQSVYDYLRAKFLVPNAFYYHPKTGLDGIYLDRDPQRNQLK